MSSRRETGHWHVRLVAALVACGLGSGQAHARSACWFPEERDAAQVRALQTMLMVGALHCRAHDGLAAEAYNRFVTAQRERLQRHDETLGRRFRRVHGRGARVEQDRYVTDLANLYSRTFYSSPFCAEVAPLADEAATADEERLLTIARLQTPPPPERACRLWDRLG